MTTSEPQTPVASMAERVNLSGGFSLEPAPNDSGWFLHHRDRPAPPFGCVMLLSKSDGDELLAARPIVEPLFDTAAAVEVDYTNHRGERSTRKIIPTGRILPGDDTYHPDARWVIEAHDPAKGALRTFDPAKIHRWGGQEARAVTPLAPVGLEPPGCPLPVGDAALRDILAERRRQVEVEGWTPEHDDGHDKAEMARAAACYAAQAAGRAWPKGLWPWARVRLKLGGARCMLVKAGALILAEIERRDRLSTRKNAASEGGA